jgi:hypothetical protein
VKEFWKLRSLSHASEKAEAIARCKEMPVILVNKVVNKKRIF